MMPRCVAIFAFVAFASLAGEAPKEELKPLVPVAEWEKKFSEKLQKKVTLEFVDTPLDETISFLRSVLNETIILEPRLIAGAPVVSLKVKDEPIASVLMKVLRQCDANQEFFCNALYVRGNGRPARGALKPFAQGNEEQKKLIELLQKKITFEFVDTPLGEGIDFIRSIQKFNIILDPEARNTPVTLRVAAMSLEDALQWIILLSETHYALRDEALFISTNDLLDPRSLTPINAEQTAAFKKAVAGLRSDEFEVRDAASKAIRAMPPAILPLLDAEWKNTGDAEAASRLAGLIDAFPRNVFEENPEVTKLLGDEKFSRKVTIDYVETPLAECVRFLNVSCNLGLEWDRSAEKKITLRIADMEARNTLRWIVRLGGAKLSVEDGKIKIAPRGK